MMTRCESTPTNMKSQEQLDAENEFIRTENEKLKNGPSVTMVSVFKKPKEKKENGMVYVEIDSQPSIVKKEETTCCGDFIRNMFRKK